MNKMAFLWAGLITSLCLVLCRGWYLNVNNHSVDWFNLVVIGGLMYWTFLWGYQAFINRNTSSAPGASRPRSFRNLEFLRVVFTIGVLTSHFFAKIELHNFGWLGVVFFFMASGFLLNYTFSADKTVGSLVKKRLIQFLPLIVCGSLLHALFFEKINIADMVAEFLLMTSTGLYIHARYNCVSWYISVLFWVSLAYFYILKTKKRENFNIICGILSFFGLIAMIKRGMSWQNTLGDKGDLGFIFDMRLVYGISCIGMGYFLAEIFKNIQNSLNFKMSKKIKIGYSFIELFLLLYCIFVMFIKYMWPGNIGIICFCYAALLLMFTIKKGYISQFFDRDIWVNLSQYCLAVYLLQSVTVLSIFDWALKTWPELGSNKILFIMLTLLSCIIFGIWAHHIIEKPCANALKKVLK